MAKKISRILALVALAALVGLMGFTVGAAGGGGGHFPLLAGIAGHGFGAHCAVSQLIDDLALTSEQQQHVAAIHNLLIAQVDGQAAARNEHLQALIQRVEQGDLDLAEFDQVLDSHLDSLRNLAHGVSAELVTLVNSLDETQRATLSEHLRQVQATADERQGFIHHHFRGHGHH